MLTNSSGSVRQGEDHKGERLDPSDLLLWDPITGRCYAVDDSACQLQAVGTVFDCNNIWANIQATGKPAEVKWDLSSAG